MDTACSVIKAGRDLVVFIRVLVIVGSQYSSTDGITCSTIQVYALQNTTVLHAMHAEIP